uniref:Iron-containing alcohol dehydrogenase n=1 Tax=Thermofilum pendens TaxID=2269 RepID=A0A7J3X737_THEPE
MKILFIRRLSLGRILSSRESFLVADQQGAELLEGFGLSPHVTVERPDVVALEEAWEEVLRGGYSRLVAVGGWAAAGSAKALSLGRRGSLRLREMLFESRAPLRRVVTVPLDVGFCTTLSELSLLWDPIVPAYYIMPLEHTVVLPLEGCEEVLRMDAEQHFTLSRDARLLSLDTPPLSNARGVVDFCLGYALRGPGPFLSLVLSLAALAERGPLEASRVLRSLYSGEKCPDWLMRLARRKLDYLVEHAWSYYSLFFAKAGLRSRYEAYRFLRSELRSCL